MSEEILKLKLSDKTDEFIDKRILSIELNIDVLLALKKCNEMEIFFDEFKKEFNKIIENI